jgi:hypothetical protein
VLQKPVNNKVGEIFFIYNFILEKFTRKLAFEQSSRSNYFGSHRRGGESVAYEAKVANVVAQYLTRSRAKSKREIWLRSGSGWPVE